MIVDDFMPEHRYTIPDSHPFARYYPDCRLMAWHPEGVLDDERADRTIEFLEWREELQEEPFNRFLDMTGYDRIEIGLDHLVRLARRRREQYQGPPIRTALFATRLISLTIARMYEELMEGSGIRVCTCGVRSAAAEWLGVPEEILRAPKEISAARSRLA